MTETTTWKRCPFCGNDDGVKVRIDGDGKKMWCFNCGAEGPWAVFGSDGTAESAWNDDRCTELDARYEALAEAIDLIEQRAVERGRQVDVAQAGGGAWEVVAGKSSELQAVADLLRRRLPF